LYYRNIIRRSQALFYIFFCDYLIKLISRLGSRSLESPNTEKVKITLFKFAQPEKHFASMYSTLAGTVMDVKQGHPEKSPLGNSIIRQLSAKVTLLKFVQDVKQHSEMHSTLAGIAMDVKMQ
jgi:hypothetical protein